MHGFRAVISITPQWISGLNSRSNGRETEYQDQDQVTVWSCFRERTHFYSSSPCLLYQGLLLLALLLSCFLSRDERWPFPLGIWPEASCGAFGTGEKLRLDFRGEVLTVLEDEEDVEEEAGTWVSLAEGSTFRWTFSGLTAGVTLKCREHQITLVIT